MSQSEVARLRESIRLSCEAAQRALYDPSLGSAKHEFITKRLENIQRVHVELETLVGADEAIKLVVETLENVEEVRNPQGEHYDEKDTVTYQSANSTCSDCGG